MRRKVLLSGLAIGGAFLLVAARGHRDRRRRSGRAVFSASVFTPRPGLDYVDPALASTAPGWAVLDTTCARLLAYPDKPAPKAFRYAPEVATGLPKISRDRRTYTFTLRSGFRFSNGAPVRASAFARAINRTLAPGVNSPGAQHTRDIVGAVDVLAGKTAATGVVARGTRSSSGSSAAPDFLHRTTTFVCAVPPTLPADPEGVGAFPAAGPYYVADYRPGERVVLRRNRFYRGMRPHHVDGFDIDLRASRHRMWSRASTVATPTGAIRPQGSTSIQVSGSSRSTGSIARGSSSGPDSPCGCWPSTRRGLCSATTPACGRRSTSRSTGGRSSTERAVRSRPSPATNTSPRPCQASGTPTSTRSSVRI